MPGTFATLFGKACVAAGEDWQVKKSDKKKESDPESEQPPRSLAHGKLRPASGRLGDESFSVDAVALSFLAGSARVVEETLNGHADDSNDHSHKGAKQAVYSHG